MLLWNHLLERLRVFLYFICLNLLLLLFSLILRCQRFLVQALIFWLKGTCIISRFSVSLILVHHASQLFSWIFAAWRINNRLIFKCINVFLVQLALSNCTLSILIFILNIEITIFISILHFLLVKVFMWYWYVYLFIFKDKLVFGLLLKSVKWTFNDCFFKWAFILVFAWGLANDRLVNRGIWLYVCVYSCLTL